MLVEDVTLIKTHEITLQVRLRGGATQTLIPPLGQRSWQVWLTPPEVVQMIDVLLNEYTDEQVPTVLNERGVRSGKGGFFRGVIIGNLRRSYKLKSRYERLCDAGMLTEEEIARVLGIAQGTVKQWYKAGLLLGYICNKKGICLYEPPSPDAPTIIHGRKLEKRRRFTPDEIMLDHTKEIQYES